MTICAKFAPLRLARPGAFGVALGGSGKECFSITDAEFSEAEAWAQALTRTLELPYKPDSPQKLSLWAALSKNDARLVECMEKGMGELPEVVSVDRH